MDKRGFVSSGLLGVIFYIIVFLIGSFNVNSLLKSTNNSVQRNLDYLIQAANNKALADNPSSGTYCYVYDYSQNTKYSLNEFLGKKDYVGSVLISVNNDGVSIKGAWISDGKVAYKTNTSSKDAIKYDGRYYTSCGIKP